MVSGSCYGWITPLLSSLLTPEGAIQLNEDLVPWVVAVFEVGNVMAPLPAGYMSNYLGRKPMLLAVAPAYIVAWMLILMFQKMWMLILARLIQGFAMAVALTVSPVYLREIASDSTRGSLASLNYNAWWLGFLIQYLAGTFMSFNTYTIFTLLLNVPFFLLFLYQPESPYYYLMVGDVEKAEQCLSWFRDSSPEELKMELQEVRLKVEANKKWVKIKEIIETSGNRRAFAVLMILSLVRVMSGVVAITVWATTMFDMTPGLFIPSNYVTIGLGVVMVCGGLVSSFTSDTFGRRPLLLISSVGSFFCQVSLAVYYFLLTQNSLSVSSLGWLSPLLVSVYLGLSSVGMYPVASSYTSELFPTKIRGVASAIANLIVAVCSALSLFLFPILMRYFGLYWNFVLNALVCLFGSIYFYFKAPETKGKSFSSIIKDLHTQDH